VRESGAGGGVGGELRASRLLVSEKVVNTIDLRRRPMQLTISKKQLWTMHLA